MLTLLKRKLKNQKGAMDKIIVTLLLVIVGVGAVVTLAIWKTQKVEQLQGDINTSVQNLENN
jgi:glycerol uptake facilitator-like aquaporin